MEARLTVGFLDPKSSPVTRAREARVVLVIDELRQIAIMNARSWVTGEEYARVAHPGKNPDGEAVRRARFRLVELLEANGIPLRMETNEHGLVFHVRAVALERLVQHHLLEAREIVERIDARSHGTEPDFEAIEKERRALHESLWSTEGVADVVMAYRVHFATRRLMKRTFRIGTERLARLLRAAGVMRRVGRQPVERHRDAHQVIEALRVHDSGGSVRKVAAVLWPCDVHSAWRFLERHGRKRR